MTMSRTFHASSAATGTSSKSSSATGKKPNDTIECLLNLRSVRDQFKDAELDLSNDKVAHQLEDMEERLVDHLAEERELRDGVGLLTVAVVGDFNSGKSTFINALLGTTICPVGDEPTTASVTHFIHGDKERFELERDGARAAIERGKYLSMVRHGRVGDRKAYVFHVSVNSPLLEHIRLVDTPGFNAPSPNTNDTRVTEEAVATAHALFVIRDAREGNPSKTLLEQLGRLRNTRRNESGPPAFLLFNKADLLPPGQRKKLRSDCEHDERFHNVTLVSALRLNDVDDTDPLRALEITTGRIRAALSRQESFEARVSAKIVTQRGQANYRMDIDGAEYDARVSSDGELASREELAAMVRSVASERHSLLESQFRRRTSQLRRDWLKVASSLESLVRRAAMTLTDAGDATEGIEHEALKAIDKAKEDILDLVDDVFLDVADYVVSKTAQLGNVDIGWIFGLYGISPHRRCIYKVANHAHWATIETVVKNLTDSLKRINDDGSIRSPDDIVKELRDHGVDIVRESLDSNRKDFEESEDWVRLWIIDFDKLFQKTIDELQEIVIRYDEKGQAEIRDRADELTKLRERIGDLKEYAP